MINKATCSVQTVENRHTVSCSFRMADQKKEPTEANSPKISRSFHKFIFNCPPANLSSIALYYEVHMHLFGWFNSSWAPCMMSKFHSNTERL